METKTVDEYITTDILAERLRTVIIALMFTDDDFFKAQSLTMYRVNLYSQEIAKLFVKYGFDENVVNKKTIHKNSTLCRELKHQMAWHCKYAGSIQYDILERCDDGDERLAYFQPVVTKGGES